MQDCSVSSVQVDTCTTEWSFDTVGLPGSNLNSRMFWPEMPAKAPCAQTHRDRGVWGDRMEAAMNLIALLFGGGERQYIIHKRQRQVIGRRTRRRKNVILANRQEDSISSLHQFHQTFHFGAALTCTPFVALFLQHLGNFCLDDRTFPDASYSCYCIDLPGHIQGWESSGKSPISGFFIQICLAYFFVKTYNFSPLHTISGFFIFLCSCACI